MNRNSTLLAISLLIIIFSSIAPAFQGGNGDLSSPYQISTVQDLLDINLDPAASYVLINNINLSPSVTGIAPFTAAPICYDIYNSYSFSGTVFTGTFDGDGYEILNLTIDTNDNNSWLSLFGKLGEDAVIKNLTLRDCSITGGASSRYISTMCSQNYKGIIDNCLSTGTVDGGSKSIYLGGFCAWNHYGTITNCRAEVDVTGDRFMGGFLGKTDTAFTSGCSATGNIACSIGSTVPDYVGGFCGMNFWSTIQNSQSSVNIVTSEKSYYVGGFCGYNGYESSGVGCFIDNCYSSGNISTGQTSYNLGGFCGYNGNQASITKSYATGNVYGGDSSRFIGGFCGYIYAGTISNCYAKGNPSGGANALHIGGFCGFNLTCPVSFCYSTGRPAGGAESNYIGGFSGYDNDNFIDPNCFWDTQTSLISTSFGGTGKTTVDMKNIDTFLNADWDFVNESDNGHMDIWFMPASDYPMFWWQSIPADFDCNMTVNLPDLIILAEYWLMTSSQLPTGYRLLGDVNLDDTINFFDFAVLAQHWLN